MTISVTLMMVTVLLAAGCSSAAHDHAHKSHATESDDPVNLVVYDETFASAGMPSARFIETLAARGFDVVVNLAPHDAQGALEHEASIVAAADMSYLNIPVDWQAPTQEDVDTFIAFMADRANDTVFLHCQMNMRATAFAFLHRVINEQTDPAIALADMHTVWTPNPTWSTLINTALERRAIEFRLYVPGE